MLAPYEFAVPSASANVAGAPTLRIEITDILANAGGLYGGPKIVQLHGVLDHMQSAGMQPGALRIVFLVVFPYAFGKAAIAIRKFSIADGCRSGDQTGLLK